MPHHIEYTYKIDITHFARLNIFFRLVGIRGSSRLHTYLDDPLILSCRLDHFPAFPDVMRHRFFHIDILTGLTGHNRAQPVPVVGCSVNQGINTVVIKDFSKILDHLRPFVLRLLDHLAGTCETPCIGIGKIGDLHVRALGEFLGQVCSPAA